jgi:hypothetical protein
MVYLAVGVNCSPQAKIAGCVPVRWRIFLLRLRNTPATANVRADFFQRKEKIEELLSGMREFSSSSGHSW